MIHHFASDENVEVQIQILKIKSGHSPVAGDLQAGVSSSSSRIIKLQINYRQGLLNQVLIPDVAKKKKKSYCFENSAFENIVERLSLATLNLTSAVSRKFRKEERKNKVKAKRCESCGDCVS